jgi:sulfatase modifying factor 1
MPNVRLRAAFGLACAGLAAVAAACSAGLDDFQPAAPEIEPAGEVGGGAGGQPDLPIAGSSQQASGSGGQGSGAGTGGGSSLAGTGGSSSGAGGSPPPKPSAPSCFGLAEACGAEAGASRDCCDSPLVIGGPFVRGYDGLASTGRDVTGDAVVSNFRLDRYEVTVGRFRTFLDQYSPTMIEPGTGKNPNNPFDEGWSPDWEAGTPKSPVAGGLLADRAALLNEMKECAGVPDRKTVVSPTWTDEPGPNEYKPINCVTWFEAYAFCIWDGGRLPTDAEWNYAASGGSEHRVFAWPSTNLNFISPAYAVYGNHSPVQPVGSKSPLGDGRWGQSDLTGNVNEWVIDWFRADYPPELCDDCALLELKTSEIFHRTLRGGAWYSEAQVTGGMSLADVALRNAVRGSAEEMSRDDGYGFRCARAE